MSATEVVDYYELLQVSQTASNDDIRDAAIRQRKQWVKRQASSDPERQEEAASRIASINRAEEVLLDPERRAAFDRDRAVYQPLVPVLPDGDTKDWLDLARHYLRDDNPGSANYAAREAVNLGANDAEAWFLRGHSSYLLGKSQDAEYEFGEAARLRPDNALYHYALGDVRAEQEKWKSALSAYELALRLEPGNPEYRTAIAQVYLENELAAKALEIMEAVVRENPDEQVFKYYLAIAIHDDTLGSLAKARPWSEGQVTDEGGWIIASAQQVELVKQRARRIAALQVDDPLIKQMLRDLAHMVNESEAMRWNLDGLGLWFKIFLAFGLVPIVIGSAIMGSSGVLMGILMAVTVTAIFVVRRRRPLWRHRIQALEATGRLERRGI